MFLKEVRSPPKAFMLVVSYEPTRQNFTRAMTTHALQRTLICAPRTQVPDRRSDTALLSLTTIILPTPQGKAPNERLQLTSTNR